jgi:hypothetical protein
MFQSADEDDRRLATAAQIAQTSILRAAIDGSRGSGTDAIVKRVNNASSTTLVATTGVDVSRHRLVF